MNTVRLTHELRRALAEAGLRGSFLARDVDTGEEVGIDADVEYPSASLVKVALALAVVEGIRVGHVDGATPVTIPPGEVGTAGPMGLSRFRHPATVAVDDLLYLAVAVSDNAAADALFDLVPPQVVERFLSESGWPAITVRHRMGALVDTPAEVFDPGQVHLAHALAIGASTRGRGSAIAQLDIARANTGTARAFIDLLQQLWAPSRLDAGSAARIRELMRHNVVRHRLAPDFSADGSVWSSKTGTLLNLRHEIGVVEHADGQVVAVAALTESSVPAAIQLAAEARIALVARRLHDQLRCR